MLDFWQDWSESGRQAQNEEQLLREAVFGHVEAGSHLRCVGKIYKQIDCKIYYKIHFKKIKYTTKYIGPSEV